MTEPGSLAPAAEAAAQGLAWRTPVDRLRSPRSAMLALALGAVLVNCLVVARTGIRHGADTSRYLGGAANLLAGAPLVEKQSAYIGYEAVVAISRWLGWGESGVILAQILLAALAVVALYDLGRELGGAAAGVLAASLVGLNPDLLRWHAYLLTDSAYTSTVVLAAWSVLRADQRGGWWWSAAAAALLLAALLRPNGWLLIPVSACYFLIRAPWPARVRGAAALAAAAAFVATVSWVGPLHRIVEAERPEAALRQGMVVWGYPNWRVQMPADPPAAPGRAGLAYAATHPWASVRLALTRIGAELVHIRPFYSAVHNGLVLVGIALIYPLALLGLVRRRRAPAARLLAGIIAAQLILVGLTFADWDGRFLLYVLPLITVLAAPELAGTVAAVRRRLVAS